MGLLPQTLFHKYLLEATLSLVPDSHHDKIVDSQNKEVAIIKPFDGGYRITVSFIWAEQNKVRVPSKGETTWGAEIGGKQDTKDKAVEYLRIYLQNNKK